MSVVKIFVFLDLEQNWTFLKVLMKNLSFGGILKLDSFSIQQSG